MVIIRKSSDLKLLDYLPPETEEIYINRRISKPLAALLLQRFPKLRKIYIPRSLYKQTSERVIQALKAVGVDVISTDRGRGRPKKYDQEVVDAMMRMRREGKSVQEIAEALGIPVRTVYYLLRQGYK